MLAEKFCSVYYCKRLKVLGIWLRASLNSNYIQHQSSTVYEPFITLYNDEHIIALAKGLFIQSAHKYVGSVNTPSWVCGRTAFLMLYLYNYSHPGYPPLPPWVLLIFCRPVCRSFFSGLNKLLRFPLTNSWKIPPHTHAHRHSLTTLLH